ncbi:unnamed protein product [Cyprideis torosa]|uniref:Uncharacterized protein n=1 Tax=Cyprideis torosa TaxID=163714 RepID=A0A7R8ZJQ1_9CRUS|nr:unnamed protein product [Cyprideis torosa]CAG0880094.1 unnamed protein product [Cyprideis torosa]
MGEVTDDVVIENEDELQRSFGLPGLLESFFSNPIPYVLGILLGVTAIRRYIIPRLFGFLKWQKQAVDDGVAHKDDDLLLRREEARRSFYMKLQQQVDAEAEAVRAKQLQAEALKAKERVEEWERLQRGGGYFSKKTIPDVDEAPVAPLQGSGQKHKEKRLRCNDFNPLMGGGSGRFIPSRRGNSRGG